MEADEVALELAKHEAVCAERWKTAFNRFDNLDRHCLLYTSPSPRDRTRSRMPSSA